MTIVSYSELLLHVLRLVYCDRWVLGSTSSSFSSLRRVPFLFLVFYFVLLRPYFMIAWLLTLLFFPMLFCLPSSHLPGDSPLLFLLKFFLGVVILHSFRLALAKPGGLVFRRGGVMSWS